jgi:hypothetical protein
MNDRAGWALLGGLVAAVVAAKFAASAMNAADHRAYLQRAGRINDEYRAYRRALYRGETPPPPGSRG